MNKQEQADQLRLAAEIIQTGHPFKHRISDNWVQPSHQNPLWAVSDGKEIRLALATPPDGRPLHNPDNLTAEQVGAGWRLVCYDDKVTADKLEKWTSGEWLIAHSIGQLSFRHCGSTYRVPLSVPWPEVEKPDPYAELKAAHAAGKVIQFWDDGDIWRDINNPNWCLQVKEYRIKPEPTFTLPPPPDEKKTGPLGPEDVPPLSMIRHISRSCEWCQILCVSDDGVVLLNVDNDNTEYTFKELCEGDYESEINRSIPLTGKWDATAWEPCHKTLANG